MPTETREQRRAAMPESGRVWDEFTAEFGTLAEFHAVENNREIHWAPSSQPKSE